MMNWYKIAQVWETSGDLRTDVEESKNKEELLRALEANDVDLNSIEEIIFPNNEMIWTVMVGSELELIEISFPYPSLEDPKKWLWGIVNSGNTWQYVDERDFNEEFWQGIEEGTIYYHGTSQENVDNILREGLSLADKTRGISNRFVGSAVFLSDSYDLTNSHYEVVLEVSFGAMKGDGYMPDVNLEEDIEESEVVSTLAHKIGLEDFVYDIEGGLDPGTIVLKDSIPPQYIRVV
jgi:hypothetical protein